MLDASEEPRGLAVAGADDSRAHVEAVVSEIRRSVGAFRRPRRADDALPSFVVGRIARYERQPGETPGLSRRLTLGAGNEAFVWPSAVSVCYTYPRKHGTGCFPPRLLRELGVVLSVGGSSDERGARMAAIVADGIKRVHVRLSSGTKLTVPVRGNGFVVALPAAPARVTWKTPDGRRHAQGSLTPPRRGRPSPSVVQGG